jgi:hypothetical protein
METNVTKDVQSRGQAQNRGHWCLGIRDVLTSKLCPQPLEDISVSSGGEEQLSFLLECILFLIQLGFLNLILYAIEIMT